jgi:23S rRNA (uracil1939-C5)-methyltransferase
VPAGRVEALSYGPHGIVRLDGKVHFVRHAAPGDEIELRVQEDRGSFAFAETVRVLAASPERREPPCPYLPRCGGCPWQHVRYEAQLRAKEDAVRDLLHRIGKLPDVPLRPIVAAPDELGYRRRLSLRVAEKKVGFLEGASHRLVPVDACLLAAPELHGSIPIAGGWVAELTTAVNRIEIAATGEGERFVVVAQADGALVARDVAATEVFLSREPRVAGAVLRGREFHRRLGDDRVIVPLPSGDSLRLRAGGFTQVGDAGNTALIRAVLDVAAVEPRHRVADLYAGAGNLSVPLARCAASVVAVERAGASAEDGRENARRLDLGNLSFETGSVRDAIARWAARGERFDRVVLDPPRSGAAEAVPSLLRLAPERIVYVSCDPATLARDLRSLSTRYGVVAVQPIDLFPQTYHVETVTLLERKPS